MAMSWSDAELSVSLSRSPSGRQKFQLSDLPPTPSVKALDTIGQGWRTDGLTPRRPDSPRQQSPRWLRPMESPLRARRKLVDDVLVQRGPPRIRSLPENSKDFFALEDAPLSSRTTYQTRRSSRGSKESPRPRHESRTCTEATQRSKSYQEPRTAQRDYERRSKSPPETQARTSDRSSWQSVERSVSPREGSILPEICTPRISAQPARMRTVAPALTLRTLDPGYGRSPRSFVREAVKGPPSKATSTTGLFHDGSYKLLPRLQENFAMTTDFWKKCL